MNTFSLFNNDISIILIGYGSYLEYKQKVFVSYARDGGKLAEVTYAPEEVVFTKYNHNGRQNIIIDIDIINDLYKNA